MMRLLLMFVLLMGCSRQDSVPANFHVKLAVPVNAMTNKAGDPIRAAVISPERLLNAYLEGRIEKAGAGILILRFDTLLHNGRSTAMRSEVVRWMNSKGHKGVDDDERPMTLESGVFRTAGSELWLDEGSEFRLRASAR